MKYTLTSSVTVMTSNFQVLYSTVHAVTRPGNEKNLAAYFLDKNAQIPDGAQIGHVYIHVCIRVVYSTYSTVVESTRDARLPSR